MFLVIIDAHTKWLEAIPLRGAISQLTIQQLRTIFSRFGLPDTVVTDNGTCFVSSEFEQFLSENGIHHWKTAPYHPASNGLVEKAVQILKQGLKKIKNGSMEERLAKLLFNYRITLQSTTGTSPAQLLFGHNLKSRLDLLKPDTSGRVEHKQQMQKSGHDRHAKTRYFAEGDEVYAHNFRQYPPWLAGKIVKTSGPLSFEIELSGGRVVRRHQDHIRQHLASAGTLDANLFDGFTDTLDVDSTDAPNRNLPEATVIVPRRNPPHNHHPLSRYSSYNYT